MNVSAWSIKNPIPAVMLFVLLTLAGLMSFNAMKVQQFPDLELPTVTVSASLPGAAPAQLETEVARKLENAIAPLQGLKNIYTSVRDGSVSVTAEFRLEKPTQEAVDDVRSAVQQVRSDLPSDVRDPIVSKMNLSGAPILAFTIRSNNMDDEALSWFVDNTISRALLGVRGVGSVARVGGVTREVQVALDPIKLQALGATAADISRQLKAVQTESAGGRADLGGSEQPMRTLATVATVEELSRLELSLSSGKRVRLDEVASVKDTVAEQRSLALLNGKPVVGFEITRSKGASEVEVGAAVQKALADLKAQHPDLELTQAFDFVTPVQEEFDASMTMLYEGAVLAVIVVWFFLRNWRATLVSAVALPLSAIPAFIGMNYMGFTTNIVTLLALSLVIGILVDDAIVEVENIERHLRMGKSPYQAAMEAADEIGLAVIATTFALIAVFLPTAFMSGVVGKFFKQFGWTAVFAVFASLVVARVLTPMMAAYIMKPSTHVHEEPVWMPLDAEPPLDHHVCGHRLFCGFPVPGAPDSQWLYSTRRQLANPGVRGAVSGQHTRADLCRSRTRPQPDWQGGTCEERVHHHRRWRGGVRPVPGRCHQRGAQGHADRAAGRARCAPGQAGDRKPNAQCAGRTARGALQGGPGGLGREVPVGAEG